MSDEDSGSKKFDEFVKKQLEAKDGSTFDYEAERDQWLAHLDTLYTTLEDFLKKYVVAGGINLRFENTDLFEEGIGYYTARKMIIEIGPQQVSLIPVGTMLIGSKGRVDAKGPSGSFRLILVNKNSTGPVVRVTVSLEPNAKALVSEETQQKIEWTWKIVSEGPPYRYFELTKDIFFEALMAVANG